MFLSACSNHTVDRVARGASSLRIPASAAPVQDAPDRFQFAIIGDRTGQARPGVFERSLQAVNRLQPRFVFGVGDQIEGFASDRAALAAQWDEFESLIDEQLDSRFFYVVGNHDVYDELSSSVWSQRRGAAYYSMRYKDVLFLVLSTEDPFVELSADTKARADRMKRAFRSDPEGTQRRILEAVKARPTPMKLPGSVQISDNQLAFAEKALGDNQDVRWTFVLLHKPAWQYQSHAFEQVERLLADRDYTVIAGHEHYYQHEQRRGRDYITMATCGGIWLRDGPGRVDHTLVVTMTDTGPKFANIKIDAVSGKSGF
jgi:calcineurin-like phosphoesterase family protein